MITTTKDVAIRELHLINTRLANLQDELPGAAYPILRETRDAVHTAELYITAHMQHDEQVPIWIEYGGVQASTRSLMTCAHAYKEFVLWWYKYRPDEAMPIAGSREFALVMRRKFQHRISANGIEVFLIEVDATTGIPGMEQDAEDVAAMEAEAEADIEFVFGEGEL